MKCIRVGTAGWSVPRRIADRFGGEGGHLERYASRFDVVEIDTSFYRPHRRTTYERWAQTVPEDFRFAVKLPKLITHERRFVDCDEALTRFAEEVGGLGPKRGPILVQLPPSFAYDDDLAEDFFGRLCGMLGGPVVCEPRHPSWFSAQAEATLRRHRIARVAADPAPVPEAADAGGWSCLAYLRLHGTPRTYWSAYGAPAIDEQARTATALAGAGAQVWVVYDNTAAGAAAEDPLALLHRLKP